MTVTIKRIEASQTLIYDTRLGYWEWVANQLEAHRNEQEPANEEAR